jgi:hypothetical protein
MKEYGDTQTYFDEVGIGEYYKKLSSLPVFS